MPARAFCMGPLVSGLKFCLHPISLLTKTQHLAEHSHNYYIPVENGHNSQPRVVPMTATLVMPHAA